MERNRGSTLETENTQARAQIVAVDAAVWKYKDCGKIFNAIDIADAAVSPSRKVM
jgi:hypothetical protein